MDSDGTDDKEDDNEEDMDETKVINGVKYKPIKESISHTIIHPFKKMYDKIGSK